MAFMHPVVGRHPAKPRKSASHSTLHRDKDAPPTSFYTARSTNSESYSPRPATSASQDYLSFPSFEAEADMLPKHSTRQRCRTGPTHWIDRPVGGRISVASTVTEGTPPDTPIDNLSFKDLDVLVAAPVSRVEMMDALVDGMNGGDKILSSRSRFDISNHHPLYHPPLPTPPPGVVLGSAKTRSRPKKPPKPVYRSSFSDEDDDLDSAPPIATPKRGRPAPIGRPPTNLTDTSSEPSPTARPSTAPSRHKRPSLAPSISEIIRAYASPEPQSSRRTSLSRTSSYSRSAGHSTPHDPDPGLLAAEEESELLSRSSIDSIADEIQQTLRRQASMTIVAPPPPPLHHHRQSFISDSASIVSPRSDGGGAASIYSASIISTRPPLSPLDPVLMSNFSKSHTSSQAVAHYLRSARLTTLLKLTRSPHASHDLPLTVSLSDLGSQNGFPVLVFLGLGCVRHIMGLYDEMAQCLGLRLITIDRWGLGRTEPRAKSAKGIMQWASVVEEVLDLLHIDTCSVMAHSAGAPSHIVSVATFVYWRHGWAKMASHYFVGGYKWLKYVPNGILKTAQAAEWKLQTWMIGKPPTMAWEGIGYTATKPNTKSVGPSSVYPSLGEAHPRPSMASSAFSAYDDLKDFEGRFESISTLGTTNPAQSVKIRSESRIEVPRKSSRSFLGRLKSPPPSHHFTLLAVDDTSPSILDDVRFILVNPH
ncbi:hypothetical protein D9757_012934 [Collybiopsis confluens]|uniref:AB hydrolase-1 domain-containing protein n=1 Tax=Collybiopsis confluens TaxID=2823264 RepID=A0A8H5GKA9_9AGAR|nr:hypothetical protein D9757_012934 [Collybiopsis confluens]